MRLGGGPIVSGPSIFGLFIWLLYLRFIIPVLGVFYGTSLVADEVEDKTITYLFTRPIAPRRGGRRASTWRTWRRRSWWCCRRSWCCISCSSRRAAGRWRRPSRRCVKDLGLLGLGLAVYGALFAWVGSQFKYPLVTGLVFAFGWEQGIMLVPGYLKRFTISYYIQGLVPHAMPQDSALSILQVVSRDSLSASMSLFWLGLIWMGFLALAAWTVSRREYVLEQ